MPENSNLAINFITPVNITPGTTGSYQTVNLTSYIPSNAAGVAFHIVSTASVAQKFGARMTSSSQDIAVNLDSPSCHNWGSVGASAGSADFYVSGLQTVYLVGWYTSAKCSFLASAVNISPSAAGSWIDMDLSAYAPAGTVGALLFIKNTGGAGYTFGFRKNGSTDTQTAKASANLETWAAVGVDSNRICEGNIQNTAVQAWLLGWITGGAIFNTNATPATATPTGSYANVTLPTSANGVFLDIPYDVVANYAVRKKGSSEDIYSNVFAHPSAIVEADTGGVFQIKASSTAANVFYINGYVYQTTIPISLTSSITASESATGQLSISGLSITITESTGVGIAEDVATLMSDGYSSVTDSITTVENLTIENPLTNDINDTIPVIENIIIGMDRQVDITDNISIIENVTNNLESFAEVIDTVTPQDGTTGVIETSYIPVYVNDTITIDELQNLRESRIRIKIISRTMVKTASKTITITKSKATQRTMLKQTNKTLNMPKTKTKQIIFL